MRILFVSTSTDPFSDISYGAAQRSHLLLKACARRGMTDVCVFNDCVKGEIGNCRLVHYGQVVSEEDIYMPVMSRYSALLGKTDVRKIYKVNREMAAVTHRLVEEGSYDLIVTRYLHEAVKCGLADFLDRLVIDIDDNPVKAHMMRLRLSPNISKRMFPSFRVLPDKIALKAVLKGCRGTFWSDPSESIFPNSACLPNIPVRRVEKVQAGEEDGYIVFFMGTLNYTPNKQGISHFIDRIWPAVRKSVPAARLRIAGNCDDICLTERWCQAEGVEYLGFAQNPEEEYRQCKVAIAPIYFGTGTNIKVLEAMAMGKPCVTTPTGVRGFAFPDDAIAVASDDESFIQETVGLLTNPAKRKRIAERALSIIDKNFTEDTFLQAADNLFERI